VTIYTERGFPVRFTVHPDDEQWHAHEDYNKPSRPNEGVCCRAVCDKLYPGSEQDPRWPGTVLEDLAVTSYHSNEHAPRCKACWKKLK